MTYDYDHRTKTAAKMDLHSEWIKIVKKHDKETQVELKRLLGYLVPYLRSNGFDLDTDRSYLDKYYSGSDGVRMSGMLVVTEREENNTYSPNADSVEKWVEMATDLRGSARKIGELPGREGRSEKRGIWQVDITAS